MLTRTIIITAEDGLHEAHWNMVEEALTDAEMNGELEAKVRDALNLSRELSQLVSIKVQ